MSSNLLRFLLLVSLPFMVPRSTGSVEKPHTPLRAPTYYIAARVTYDGDPNELRVAGASNLPTGARLSIHVSRFVGEGGSTINQDATAVIDREGFFDVSVHPMKGNTFQHNLACDIVFMARTYPPQPASVLDVVGTHGERLGFPKNPQTEVSSGENYVLSELVHVP